MTTKSTATVAPKTGTAKPAVKKAPAKKAVVGATPAQRAWALPVALGLLALVLLAALIGGGILVGRAWDVLETAAAATIDQPQPAPFVVQKVDPPAPEERPWPPKPGEAYRMPGRSNIFAGTTVKGVILSGCVCRSNGLDISVSEPGYKIKVDGQEVWSSSAHAPYWVALFEANLLTAHRNYTIEDPKTGAKIVVETWFDPDPAKQGQVKILSWHPGGVASIAATQWPPEPGTAGNMPGNTAVAAATTRDGLTLSVFAGEELSFSASQPGYKFMIDGEERWTSSAGEAPFWIENRPHGRHTFSDPVSGATLVVESQAGSVTIVNWNPGN